MKLLEVDNITKHFGGLAAVTTLSFHLLEGEILGLIGPNGAGKTTVFNMITGALRPTHGEIFLRDRRITGLKPNRIAKLGAVRTFQLTNLFMDMTVLHNVILGTHHRSDIGVFQFLSVTKRAAQSEVAACVQAEEILDFMALSGQRDVLAKNLPHGQQRRLELAIALAANPQLLLLDEPLQGMNHDEVSDMLVKIGEIRMQGKSILLVEHNMKAVTNICDRVVVLDFGKKLAEGPPLSVMQNNEVIRAYLGE